MRERPVRLQEFAALTFDCYGTLIDWERGLLAVLRPWADAAGVRVSDDDLLQAFAAAESAAERDRPRALYSDILREAHGAIARRFGVDLSSAAADALARSVGDWPAFPDTPGALRSLRARCKLVIVSNVDHASFARTRPKLGVEPDGLVTAEDVGSYKPALAHFERAIELLGSVGVSKDRVLHVAQSLYHDHAPAKSLGLTTAWIDRRRGRAGGGATPPPPEGVRPDFVFASMAQLAAAVEAAHARL